MTSAPPKLAGTTTGSFRVKNEVGFHDSYARQLSDGYGTERDLQERLCVWQGLIDKYLPSPGAGLCLDVGCGPGVMSRYVADKGVRTIGIDPSPVMLEIARQRAGARNGDDLSFVSGALPAIRLDQTRRADLVLCSSVLEYVEDLDAAVLNLRDLLAGSGGLIVGFPNRQSVYRALEHATWRVCGVPSYCAHVRHSLRPDDAAAFLARHGFAVLECVFYGSGPRPVGCLTKCLADRWSKNLYALALRQVPKKDDSTGASEVAGACEDGAGVAQTIPRPARSLGRGLPLH